MPQYLLCSGKLRAKKARKILRFEIDSRPSQVKRRNLELGSVWENQQISDLLTPSLGPRAVLLNALVAGESLTSKS